MVASDAELDAKLEVGKSGEMEERFSGWWFERDVERVGEQRRRFAHSGGASTPRWTLLGLKWLFDSRGAGVGCRPGTCISLPPESPSSVPPFSGGK